MFFLRRSTSGLLNYQTSAWDLYLCQQDYFFKKIFRLDRRGGRWSEGRRTADFCFCPGLAVLELLTSFSLFFSFAQTRSWRECCSVPSWMLPMYTISCAKRPSWKTKTDGFWRKREVGGDWSEGLKGTDGKWGESACWGECGEMGVTHGSCYYDCYAFHVELSCEATLWWNHDRYDV